MCVTEAVPMADECIHHGEFHIHSAVEMCTGHHE